MKYTFKFFLVIVNALAINQATSQVKSNHLSFHFFDSVVRIHKSTLIDLTFPCMVNNKISSPGIAKPIQSFNGIAQLYHYESNKKKISRDKIIFSKNNINNFQFFYLNQSSYKLGIGYYAYGQKSDECKDTNIPYIPSRLDAYSISDSPTEKYIVVYNKKDDHDTFPNSANKIRIFLVDSNYLPIKIIFYDKERGCYLYNTLLKKMYKMIKSIDLFSESFSSIFCLDNYGIDDINKIRETKNVPFWHWYLK